VQTCALPISDGQGDAALAGVSDAGDDVRHAAAAEDRGRSPVDHPVPHAARGRETGVLGGDELFAYLGTERCEVHPLTSRATAPRSLPPSLGRLTSCFVRETKVS